MSKTENLLLENAIKEQLPEFHKMCNTKGNETIILTQQAFGLTEIDLLGAAIKYAGVKNKTITII